MNFELLAPAGNMEKLKTVFHYGADAVYLGGKAFNLRSASHNFNHEQLKEAVDYAHILNKKVYVTLNIIAHNREIKALPNFIKYLEEIGVDAVIAADLGVMALIQENSDLPIHVSTQASTANWRAVKQFKTLGAKRVVLARECTINEIKQIKDKVPDVELETFVHGAMCMAYSGRCMISSYLSSRDSNRGACSNACRWNYSVMEETRPGEYFPVHEDETGSYLYNSKDLCTIEFIDQLLDAGIEGLKIEGRMKTMFYGATVIRVYRQALDSYLSGNYKYENRWLEELKAVSHRQYTSGFYHGKLDSKSQNLEGKYERSKEFVGQVKEKLGDGRYLLDIRGRKIKAGDELQLLSRNESWQHFKMPEMIHIKSQEKVEEVNPNTMIEVKLPLNAEPFDVIQMDARQDVLGDGIKVNPSSLG